MTVREGGVSSVTSCKVEKEEFRRDVCGDKLWNEDEIRRGEDKS